MDDRTLILEPGEYCEVCGGTERLGRLVAIAVVICFWCFEDTERVTVWLAGEIEKALEADPTAERLPDGRWKFTDIDAVMENRR